jgi:hypothetical protein
MNRESNWLIKGVDVNNEVLQHGANHIEGFFKVTDIDDDYVTLNDGSIWHKQTGRRKDIEKRTNYYGPWIALLKT